MTYSPIFSGLCWVRCDMSTQQYDRFVKNVSMSSLPKPARSRFPSSISLPNSATHFHDACSSSPESEFRTMSTPRPPVSCIRSDTKDTSRELKMWFLGISKVSTRYCAFCVLPTVAKIFVTCIRWCNLGFEVGETYLRSNHPANLNGSVTNSTASRMD